jgi:hypothetical protein
VATTPSTSDAPMAQRMSSSEVVARKMRIVDFYRRSVLQAVRYSSSG